MTDRGARKCLARLETAGYIKRLIHAGRTKANDYLIPGLNTERQFHKTGTDVPENRNSGSAHISKERKKEREASEEKASFDSVSPPTGAVTQVNVFEHQFQNQLAVALGGGKQGWVALMDLPADMLEELQRCVLDGSMSIGKAANAALAELAMEDAKS